MMEIIVCPNLSISTVIVFQIRRILLNTERFGRNLCIINVEFREEGCYISCLKKDCSLKTVFC